MPNTGERRFKKGQIICRPGEMEMNMYNILYGCVGVYTDYGKPEQVEVVKLREGDFFNVISFLESRPRNTTVVALEPLVVSEISFDNFGKYFRDRPAKVMSLLQHMSARIRQLQKAYVEMCHGLRQLTLRVPGQTAAVGDEQHRAQHVALAEHGSGYGGGERLVVLADTGHGAQPGEVVDAALGHDLLQLIGHSLAQQLPLAGARHGDHGVPVGDGGGEVGAAAQCVTELGGKVLQPADEGVFLEDDLPLPRGVDLQRVTLADAHGAADLLGDDNAAKIVDPAHDPCCFHI